MKPASSAVTKKFEVKAVNKPVHARPGQERLGKIQDIETCGRTEDDGGGGHGGGSY